MTVFDPSPLPIDPAAFVRGLRYIQQRMPEFAPLSAAEKRTLVRAASLDPEFRNAGIVAGGMWPHVKTLTGRTAAELSAEADEIARWDEVVRELEILARGIADSNLKRKNRLGTAILQIYSVLGASVYGIEAPFPNLLPYFEAMKIAYQKWRKKSRKTTSEGKPETGE